MLEKIKYFFRGTPDGYVFPTASVKHWTIMAFVLIGLEFIIKCRIKFKNSKYEKVFKILMIFMLSIQQIILYLWYELSGYFTIHESLPLYNCRLAIIFTIFAFITNKDFYKNICCYWGVTGSFLALIFPALDPFQFPHFTGISFFVGHTLLLWSAIYFLVVDKHKINKKSLGSVLIFTNIYHGIILIFNGFTNSNYCYLNAPPFSIGIIEKLPQLLYTCIIFTAFNIMIILFYFTYKVFYLNNLRKENVENYI